MGVIANIVKGNPHGVAKFLSTKGIALNELDPDAPRQMASALVAYKNSIPNEDSITEIMPLHPDFGFFEWYFELKRKGEAAGKAPMLNAAGDGVEPGGKTAPDEPAKGGAASFLSKVEPSTFLWAMVAIVGIVALVSVIKQK